MMQLLCIRASSPRVIPNIDLFTSESESEFLFDRLNSFNITEEDWFTNSLRNTLGCRLNDSRIFSLAEDYFPFVPFRSIDDSSHY